MGAVAGSALRAASEERRPRRGLGRPSWAGSDHRGENSTLPGFYFAFRMPGREQAGAKPLLSSVYRPLVVSGHGLRLAPGAVPCLTGRGLRRSAAVTSSRPAFHDQE